ncbi:MAG: hypothetical protein PHO32_00790 [Candidatus Cloacimonetes bacterium]|nr:hypothetical protein [Candidatus Cloacimonadota bacterium]
MDEFDDKLKERWQHRRKKSYNWTKLAIMVFAVVAIFWAMNHLQNSGSIVNNPSASVIDSTQTDTLNTGTAEQTP